MTSNTGGWTCAAVCWGVALAAGVFAMAMLIALGGWSAMQGIFAGVVIAVILGAVLSLLLCRPLPAPQRPGSAGQPATDEADMAATGAAAPAAPAPQEAPAAEPVVAEAPQPEPVAALTPAPDPQPEPAPAPEPQPAPEPVPAPVTSGDGTRPVALDGPRDGQADDLKRIKGVGPKLEQLCNRLGFYHFDQIAGWSAEEVAWVDQNLEGFKGRVTRDNWVEQARLLAEGGDTAFSRKVDKGDVY